MADLWFDPICPWSWLTCRWLLEVERVREVQVRFHVMSLSVLHEGRASVSEFDERTVREGWGPVRVAIATDLSHGSTALRELYTALGTLIHKEHAPINRDLYARALTRSASRTRSQTRP